MATLSVLNPTLLDFSKALDPDGKIATIIEILNEQNDILEDMAWMEGNLIDGHKSSIRTGLPAPTWRKFYGGVQPSKGRTAQITDGVGMMEAYAEVDKALADLNGNTAAFRLLESRGHLEGMMQEMADTLFYGDADTEPETFNGLAPRFNSLSAENAENIIDAGGTGTDNASIWLVVWRDDTCHGIFPKGSKAGWTMTDKGQVTLENVDGNGGRMEAYRTHFRWDAGLVVRDWRYVVRICNIDKSLLTADASTGAKLPDLMFEALNLPPNLNGRPAFYMPRAVRTTLFQQLSDRTKSSTLTSDRVGGKIVNMFHEVPIRRCDALAGDEARVT